MRSFKANGGPFGERLHYELDEIDRICVEALSKAGYLPNAPAPVRIDRFVEKHFECDTDYRELDRNILGCIVFLPQGKVERIIIASHLEDGKLSNERRLRSTLAHEAGHGLLHAHLFIQSSTPQGRFDFDAKERVEDRILCRQDDISDSAPKPSYNGKWWEYQANRAIGGLLLPKKLVHQAVAMFLQSSDLTRVSAIPANRRREIAQNLSEVFNVNPIVAQIRISEMWPDSAAPELI